jgi:hypothetical protein
MVSTEILSSIILSAFTGASGEWSLRFDLGTAWSIHIYTLLILWMEVGCGLSIWRQSRELFTTASIIHHHILLIWIIVTSLKTFLTSCIKVSLTIILR